MQWQSPKNFPSLEKNQVHIWRTKLTKTKVELNSPDSILNKQEKKRAAKYLVKHAANNFIITRSTLRTLLGKYLQKDPRLFTFQQNEFGKPYIDNSSLQFNVSHSHDYALFIFALDSHVGIDIELIQKDFDFINIAKRFFSKTETSEILALPQNQQVQAFFNCWACKESYIKALGTGIYTSLSEFSVETSNNKAGKRKLSHSNNKPTWSLEAIDPADHYTGAFTIDMNKYTSRFFEFEID